MTIIATISFGCKEEDKINPKIEDDNIIEDYNSPPDSFEVHVQRVMYNYAEIIWQSTSDPEGDSISYSIYLNQIMHTNNVTNLSSFRFENLIPETKYEGAVCAKDTKGDSILAPFSFTTIEYFFSFSKLITIQDRAPGAHSIDNTNDGGYILGGTINFGNSYDLIAVKTDSIGNIEWYSIFKYNLDGDVVQILQTSDNGYILVSRKKIFKLNERGEIIWEYTKKEDLNVGLLGYRSVIQSESNEYYLTGSVRNSSNLNSKITSITKFSSDGKLLWEKYYGNKKWNEGCFIEKSHNNNFVILGTTGNDSEDLFFLEINLNGDILIEKIYEDPNYDFARQIKRDKDGGYIIAGYSWGDRDISDIRILKLSSLGEIVWDKKYRWGSFQDVAYAITQVKDGGYIFTGTSSDNSSKSQPCILAKVDKNGEILWNKLLKPDYLDYSWSCKLPRILGQPKVEFQT